MDFDLEAILTLLTVLSGLIWLVDALVFARRRRRKQEAQGSVMAGTPATKKRRDPILVEYSRSFFPVLLLVLLLRTFVVEPFHIPSSSMVPTLLVGDFILVNKFDYGLRLPITHTKILRIGEPKRGDVMVFRYPPDPSVDYIKRVIGLPGDHIVYRGETLYINGKQIPDKVLGLYAGPDQMGAMLHQEDLGGVKHDTLIIPGMEHKQGEWTVPPGEYFVMGDNRDNSSDSRYWKFVPEKNIIGKAFFVWMNWDAFHDSALWHRVGTVIH
ncbi:MAG: signal peptidase I [Gammaproteobacteria bacterium]|nr:signal peptidase I [Gammaproteobacteria bacterium]MBU6508860.1 signal peptidase I [Gammaproteobacteria bacterium]MDE1983483.1 signal peptidase I [Gammaproteobacteria bacterium]MDE2108855.1 signal peptidase I [Gammaproteobacteria bacterium]MDE2460198.1 signal peptidase I [Gammaproteobacteria bacterium]